MIKRAVSRERKERKKEKKRREKKDSKSGDIIRSMYYSLSSFKVNRDRWALMSAKKMDKRWTMSGGGDIRGALYVQSPGEFQTVVNSIGRDPERTP